MRLFIESSVERHTSFLFSSRPHPGYCGPFSFFSLLSFPPPLEAVETVLASSPLLSDLQCKSPFPHSCGALCSDSGVSRSAHGRPRVAAQIAKLVVEWSAGAGRLGLSAWTVIERCYISFTVAHTLPSASTLYLIGGLAPEHCNFGEEAVWGRREGWERMGRR